MNYDLAIIGGGPAGMMAGGRAGELGSRVILLEKNNRLGLKLLATGGSRCNLTNKIENNKDLIANYGPNGKFLFSAFNKFGVKEVMEFFESRGLELKVENNNRVFPKSDKAQDVLNVLLKYLRESKVEVVLNSELKKIIKQGNSIEKVILTDGRELKANNYLLAVGGKSYPETGSSGEIYKILKDFGHTIIEPRPALAPLILKDKFIKDLQGLSLADVLINVYQANKKIAFKRGELLFTGDGLSGPAVINLSKIIGSALPNSVELKLDFFPELNLKELDAKIQALFSDAKNKLLKNTLSALVAPRLATLIINLAKIDLTKPVNLITREERSRLINLLKEFKLEVKALAGFDKAMVTAGGVALNEVDPQTMKSKIIDNLFFSGEVLDLDGPTGGFNLQIAWSTGHLAGENL